MESIICSVEGMQNKECKTQLKNALNKVQGVQAVGVNLAAGVVTVDYNQPATATEIKSCIENTGFKISYE